jgi:hypothetical protein
MLVTLLGIVTDIMEVQPLKAYIPMLVTLLGIETDVKDVQPRKAYCQILVTLFGIIYELILPAGYCIRTVLALLNRTPSSLT